ncbi:MAG: precorrin-6A reductase [Candidatus Syntrophonatronum acetioxidans]|uniref:Precorrin-6A reductase n=1 Tax=Candidatus Syntrophonatronum acetioxidans TaxID=1795816 RepID=A0A424YAR5_9FIRM|nr:MAG: precorrin-6A reductase [Candidatus Syntrophonatronum acetioxidans]
MILVLGGTTEGKRIDSLLREKGFNTVLAAVTEYGVALAREEGSLYTRQGALEMEGMSRLIKEKNIKMVVDATHPFAVQASLNAMEAARSQGRDYLRLERPSLETVSSSRISWAEDFKQAAGEAVKSREKVFLAIGVNNLQVFFKKAEEAGVEIIARVLPLSSSLDKCLKLGLKPSRVVAIQGGGSRELNKALFKEFKVGVLVTKDSGKEWTEEKVKGALELGMKVIIVKRPLLHYGEKVFGREEELVEHLQKILSPAG